MREMVGPTNSFELKNNPKHNVLKLEGLKILLRWIVSIIPEGLVWLGVPCSTWILLSRGSTGRSALSPSGPPGRQSKLVIDHNTIADIASYIILTAEVLNLHWVIEQPQSSLLFAYDSMKDAIAKTSAQRVAFFMVAFGGESKKPLQLRGTGPWMGTFAKAAQGLMKTAPKRDAILTDVTIDATGRRRFQGRPTELQRSSAYTREMGKAIAMAMKGETAETIIRVIQDPLDSNQCCWCSVLWHRLPCLKRLRMHVRVWVCVCAPCACPYC